jgi:hypothetical protein
MRFFEFTNLSLSQPLPTRMKATMIAALVAPAVATEMCVEGVARDSA